MSKILLVEDDQSIVRNLMFTLEQEEFSVTARTAQREAVSIIKKEKFDLVLLDLTLPDGNGFAICTAIKHDFDIPIIFLTATDDEANVVTGFNLGAGDYIIKPFRPLELISRTKNALRRYGKIKSVFNFANLKVDSVKGIVTKNNDEIFLTALEYSLLLVFLNNEGIVLTLAQLLRNNWVPQAILLMTIRLQFISSD